MDLHIHSTRGGIVESVHRVSLAVVDHQGALVAHAGDPGGVTFWRSAAKPFQAIPVVAEGAAERFGLSGVELALACASHSSEPLQLDAIEVMLQKIGIRESDLACGPHPPLSSLAAEPVPEHGSARSPRWSNCSGKHAGMLALARHKGWPLQGYEVAGHQVQERILDEIVRWTGMPATRIHLAVDGCTAVSYALPLRAMATAYARLVTSSDWAALRILGSMVENPYFVAGTGRLCTDLMEAYPGRIIAKIGAEGVYGAGLPDLGFGIALKVNDGDMRSAPIALLAVLRQLSERFPDGLDIVHLPPAVGRHAETSIRDAQASVVGALRPSGVVRFSDELRVKPVPSRHPEELL